LLKHMQLSVFNSGIFSRALISTLGTEFCYVWINLNTSNEFLGSWLSLSDSASWMMERCSQFGHQKMYKSRQVQNGSSRETSAPWNYILPIPFLCVVIHTCNPLGLIHGGGFRIYSLPQCLYGPLRALDAASGGKGGTTESHYLWITPKILKWWLQQKAST
jgi:hypothetical protein